MRVVWHVVLLCAVACEEGYFDTRGACEAHPLRRFPRPLGLDLVHTPHVHGAQATGTAV